MGKGAVHKTGEGRLGKGDVIYQHEIVIVGPDSWQVAKVVAQLATGMRRCEIAQVRGQCNVVFGIKNM